MDKVDPWRLALHRFLPDETNNHNTSNTNNIEINPSIIYQGCKTLWRLRSSIDVCIVFHPKGSARRNRSNSVYDVTDMNELGDSKKHLVHDGVYEVIVYDFSRKKECFNRLYLSYEKFLLKYEYCNEFKDKLSMKIEEMIRKKEHINHEEIKKISIHEHVSQYVIARINVEESSNDLVASLTPQFGDILVSDIENSKHIDVELMKPKALQAFETTRDSVTGDFSKTLEKFQNETANFDANVDKASKFSYLPVISDVCKDFINKLTHRNSQSETKDYEKLPSVNPNQKWKKATNRVVNQNMVKNIKNRLKISSQFSASNDNDVSKVELNNIDNGNMSTDNNKDEEATYSNLNESFIGLKSAPHAYYAKDSKKMIFPSFSSMKYEVPSPSAMFDQASGTVSFENTPNHINSIINDSEEAVTVSKNNTAKSTSNQKKFVFSADSAKIKFAEGIEEAKQLRKWKRLPPLPKGNIRRREVAPDSSIVLV